MGKSTKRNGKKRGLPAAVRKRIGDFFGKVELNVWRIITIVVVAITAFIILRTLYSVVKMKIEISHLNSEKQTYLQSIEADSLLLESLKYDEHLEEYAREKYHMQRKGEQVFIFEED
ncbi:MAG: septum formation initiator family protein [Alistipes sp.]|nr:septum formation initiator family protein [Alistipes sp.]